jgi:hypothetical protein
LVHCHAGCSQEQVIAALRALGLWQQSGVRQRGSANAAAHSPHVADEDASRIEAALRLWRITEPAIGTPVEAYLRSRGIDRPLPPTLGFAELRHQSGDVLPAMVALVTRGIDNEPLGVLRTFLAPDGNGKASVTPVKMMLGPCRGGAVRLAALGNILLVGEGIETVLSVMQATGLPGWAALSTSGLCALELPQPVRDIIILADGDDAGEAAVQSCALRWKREGRLVRIARPPRGSDFNDLLQGRVASVKDRLP